MEDRGANALSLIDACYRKPDGDTRNGFSIQPQLTLKIILNILPPPWWWFDFLATPALTFASLQATEGIVEIYTLLRRHSFMISTQRI